MNKQKGYLLVSVAFIVLLSSFILIMLMQTSNLNHHRAMTAFTEWRTAATAESTMGKYMLGASSYNTNQRPIPTQLQDVSDFYAALRDSQTKIIKKTYRLDVIGSLFHIDFFQASHYDPAFSIANSWAPNQFVETTTNIRETHVITFPMVDMPYYNECVASGYTEEVTIAPKVDVVFDEKPEHTLSYCLKSKGVKATHLYQINYGLLDNGNSYYNGGTSVPRDTLNEFVTMD